jgi:hypothetical protein
MAAALFDETLIDLLQLFDLYKCGKRAIGKPSRSSLNSLDQNGCATFTYDGRIYSETDGVRLTLGLSMKTGRISCLCK